MKITAFSDPNDALSYYVSYDDNNSIEFTNVTIAYAKWWLFNRLAHPLTAHGGFMTDDIGITAITGGSESLEELSTEN